MPNPRILIVEDDPDGCRSAREAIEDIGCDVSVAMTGEDGVRLFREDVFDVVLTDLILPGIDGVEVLSLVQKIDSRVPVLIMTAYGSVASAVEALKSGAYDYITKPLDLDDLQSRVSRAAETRRLRTEVAELHESMHERYSAHSMVAASESMRDVVAEIEALADTSTTVLIQGESGTGKELVARALHVDGKRHSGPFVAVNCGAFAENLLESELFGHEKGAFTGAAARRRGAFERADSGTIFLDEIGNASPTVQIRLLRVIEEREIVRVGGQSTIPVDVRLVSASNRDLEDMVQAGEFREDLLYRLKVVTIETEPLRTRRDDIRPLVDRFIAAVCQEHGRAIATVTPDCYAALEEYDWPGNVRQLRNMIEASVVMTRGSTLEASDLRITSRRKCEDEKEFTVPDGMTLAMLEKEAMLQLLRKHNGNRTIVAEKLAVSRRTIQRKIKEYNLPFA